MVASPLGCLVGLHPWRGNWKILRWVLPGSGLCFALLTVKGAAIKKALTSASAIGAVLAMLCGWLLGWTPPGEPWVNASYDNLFRFGSQAVTNRVTLILMDSAAYEQFHQVRGQPWDRALHAQLLNRLADDGCPLVVMDSFFREGREPEKDAALCAALRRQKKVVLMAEQSAVIHPLVSGVQPDLPAAEILAAAGTNWGVGWLDPDLDGIVRRHWPTPCPGPYPSLPWTAARLAGAKLDARPQERWLRYYGEGLGWTSLSYVYALTQPRGYFRDQIVFIGTAPKTSLPDGAEDKFRAPTGAAVGGVEIQVTAFLNLMNHAELHRLPTWAEFLVLAFFGGLLGGGLCWLRWSRAMLVGVGLGVGISLAAVIWSYYSNYWFPWLVVVSAQLPCAMVWATVQLARRAPVPASPTQVVTALQPPVVPGYKVFFPPIGEGAYGRVWLGKNPAGQWRAIKVIYLDKFEGNSEPFERELAGVRRYQPVSHMHPGFVKVDFVKENLPESFCYTMELGDSIVPGWETNPALYKPRDLVKEREGLPGKRFPVLECIRLGISLSETLHFLHQQGLTHRDIKPQNVIFVQGRPKLADLGLITDIRPKELERTLVGTPGFMPPLPESPGTPQADIFALGMVLYVISTGRPPKRFPAIATSLIAEPAFDDFLPLNEIIDKACQPRMEDRYATAAELQADLEKLLQQLTAKSDPCR
jgi:CHASE2 domain-containing sensor protein